MTFVCKNVFMRTTLDLPDDTFRRLKAQAALNGLKLKALVTQYIERGLAAGPDAPAAVPSPTRPPIPVARKADGRVNPAWTNAQLHGLLELQDIEQLQAVSRPGGNPL
jgi:hypothetical protein